MEIAARLSAALACVLALCACGGGGGEPPPPPVTVSLLAPSPAEVSEADNPMVEVVVQAASASHSGATVALGLAGTATRGHDYAISSDSVVLAPNALSASVTVDVYRDFDEEGDESITVTIDSITGHAQPGTASSVTITLLDGEAATLDKELRIEEDGGFLVLIGHRVTETSVDLTVTPFAGMTNGEPLRLIAEWSRDADFATDVNRLDDARLVPPDGEMFSFFQIHEFSLPLRDLAANGRYFLRAYIESLGPDPESAVHLGFATDESGRVVTRCRVPGLRPAARAAGADPLFSEQWHLENTGQTGFSERSGVAGADLRMTSAIADGRDGAGVKLAIVDTGLEICHPDLAANIEPGKSFNFAHELAAGASPDDPFNHIEILGDHGTSVAGVAGAAAGNGAGGRGVAPAVRLRGFGGLSAGVDVDADLLASLGASSRSPDSASADIFNMSFGVELPGLNSEADYVRLFAMGVNDLRGGRGALYVKAAGNEFGFCESPHPLHAEIGCVGSNADPDHNLPYLITVGAFNARDVKSSYSNAGANLWVVVPAGETGVEEAGVITTDQAGPGAGYSRIGDDPLDGHPLNEDGDYTAVFGGTSAAAGAASGAVAVLLGVNPQLTWRDVRHILAKTARRIDADRPRVRAAFNGKPYVAQHAWQTNAAGYAYHNWYGFGAIAIDDAVAMAADHAADSLGAFVESQWHPPDLPSGLQLEIPDADGGGVTDTLTVSGLPDTASIEGVTVEISAMHSFSPDLGVAITSPGGTESIVNAPFNAAHERRSDIRQWRLLSNAFYGENPNGEWTIRVADLASGDTGQLESWRLRFHYGEHPAD